MFSLYTYFTGMYLRLHWIPSVWLNQDFDPAPLDTSEYS